MMSFIATAVIGLLKWFFSKKDLKDARKRKYLSYIEYWEKHRVTPVEHGDDIANHLKDEVK